MAGVPLTMQAMLDEVAPKLKTGIRMLSETGARTPARATSARSSARSPSASGGSIRLGGDGEGGLLRRGRAGGMALTT